MPQENTMEIRTNSVDVQQKRGRRGVSQSQILKTMPVREPQERDSQGLSFIGLFLPNSDLCKETIKTHPGSPHTERTNPSAFTHLKTFFNKVFPSVVCVAQCYFLFHVFLLFP